MKIVCIKKNNYHFNITISKTYDVIEEEDYGYIIINDRGIKDWFPKYIFKLLSEIRNEIIDKLLA